jgi:hypothetical protein
LSQIFACKRSKSCHTDRELSAGAFQHSVSKEDRKNKLQVLSAPILTRSCSSAKNNIAMPSPQPPDEPEPVDYGQLQRIARARFILGNYHLLMRYAISNGQVCDCKTLYFWLCDLMSCSVDTANEVLLRAGGWRGQSRTSHSQLVR